MNKCTIYYGMSGTLKLTTINSLHHNDFKVFSDTKPFFEMDEQFFNWSSRPNDAHLAIHRILTLDLPGYLPINKDIVIERGVTDNVFMIPNRKIPGISSYSEINIRGLVDLELSILYRRSGIGLENVCKKLLVMNDRNFIKFKSLSNQYRRALYPDVDSYLRCQDNYIEFTNLYNNINEVIEINNAEDYITKTLNIEYE